METGSAAVEPVQLPPLTLKEADKAGWVASLREMCPASRGICLGLPSEMVFSAWIDCGNLPRKNRRTAMLYRLEEQIPLEAERLTADFLPCAGGQTLGLAVETHRVLSILELLADAGVQVASICPTAMLSLWQTLRDLPQAPNYVLLAFGSRIDIFRCTDGHPDVWYSVSADAKELIQCLHADRLSASVGAEKPTVCVVGELPADLLAGIQSESDLVLAGRIDHSPLLEASKAAGDLLRGRPAGWVDFRRDNLALPNILGRLGYLPTLAMCLLIALLTVLTLGMQYRALRYEGRIREYESRQAAIYGKLYPNVPAPPSVTSRMRSELLRLKGISGAVSDLPEQPSALEMLRAAVAGLPADMRLRIRSMRFGPEGLFMDGEARGHGDAQAIAQSLVRGGFAMEPPRTDSLDKDTVSFTLAGKFKVSEQASGKRGSH